MGGDAPHVLIDVETRFEYLYARVGVSTDSVNCINKQNTHFYQDGFLFNHIPDSHQLV